MRRARYAVLCESGLSNELLGTRLEDLMFRERVWLDEELSLSSLSAKLLTTPHRLSAFINDSFRVNFNTYINRFRVQEAQRLLVEEPEWSVLRIALMSGFNSKSVFYRCFTKEAGISPTLFREKQE